MSLEFFGGFDGSEGLSPEQLEKVREQMRKAAAQIKAIQKEEKKAKKTEDELIKILLKYIQTAKDQKLILLVSEAIKENIPANFILAVISLTSGEITAIFKAKKTETVPDDKALAFFDPKDHSFPLKFKIALDLWIKLMLEQAQERAQKLVQTVYKVEKIIENPQASYYDRKYRIEKSIKTILSRLIAYVIEAYLQQNHHQEDSKQIEAFSRYITTGIVNHTEEFIGNQKLLN